MTSTWILPVLLLGTLTSAIIAQEFSFNMLDRTVVYEGRDRTLIINITRTGPNDQEANVSLVAYELSNNNKKEWEIPVVFFANEAFRALPLGVIDDTINDPDRLYIFMLKDPSTGYTLGALTGAVVSYIDNDGPSLFDCRVDDTCVAGSCNSDTGHCDCPVGLGYPDCSLDLDTLDVPSTLCSAVTCGIGGVCIIDATNNAKCACQPGYGGADCARSDKYDVMCYRDGMCLNVRPPSTYVGSRYIRGKDGIDECMLKEVTADAITNNNLPSHWLGGSFICLADQDAKCGNADYSIRDNGFSSYSREVHIRRTNDFILHRDILFTGNCVYDNSGVLYVTHTVNPGMVFPINRTDSVESTSIYLVNKQTGQQYTKSVFSVGDEICFALDLTASFSGLRLNNVIADDRQEPPATHQILQNGCPRSGSVDVVTELPYLPNASDKTTLHFCFSAFSFATSEEIGLRFETTVCPVSDTACTPYSCDGEQSYGRKKRDIQISNNIFETKIRVVEPTANSERLTDEEETMKECTISKAIIAALSILAVVALILLFATILLVIRSTRSRDKLNE